MLSDDGERSVRKILDLIESKAINSPATVSIGFLAAEIGTTPQNIGMAFSDYIEPPLHRIGIGARKIGTPRRIELQWEETIVTNRNSGVSKNDG